MSMVGGVYTPPRPGLPYVAVVLNDGQVVSADAVPSPEVGEAMIATIFKQFAADKAAGKI